MRRAPLSLKLNEQIKALVTEVGRFSPGEMLTLVGFAWQPVFTLYGQPYSSAVVETVDQLTSDRCWRALLYTSTEAERGTRVHILDVSGQRCYSLLIDLEGISSWVMPDERVELILRGIDRSRA